MQTTCKRWAAETNIDFSLYGTPLESIPALLRVAMAVGGLGMMIPGTATDIAGFVLVVGIVLYQRFSARRAAMV